MAKKKSKTISHQKKTSPSKVGLVIGIMWAGYVFLLGMLAAFFNVGRPIVSLLGSMYLGYNPSFSGSLIGLVWAFLDGFIAGFIGIWLYNKIK
ncbi:bacteriophage holin [Candidatus Woesearchaeota archaeon]|nr:bacteriophage holin [Candidatus Woesearchaeota archaeon]